MAKLSICYLGNPILREKAKDVEKITPEIKTFIRDMEETMRSVHGIGLAAPQVGKSLQIFIVCSYEEDEEGESVFGEVKAYINPVVTYTSKEDTFFDEGCLSIPGITAKRVKRPPSIHVKAQDINGRVFEENLSGFYARMIMHEYDHLQGVLMIDRIKKEDLALIKGKLQEIENVGKAQVKIG